MSDESVVTDTGTGTACESHWLINAIRWLNGEEISETSGNCTFQFQPSDYLILTILAFQLLLFVGVWWALSVERKQQLRLQGIDNWWERAQDALVRLGIPHGAIFLNLGICGTFLGMMFGLPEMLDLTTKAMSDDSEITQESLKKDLIPMLGSFGVALLTSVLGILLSLIAKATFRPCEISQSTTRGLKLDLLRLVRRLEGRDPNAKEGELLRAGFYIEAVSVLMNEIARRRDHIPSELADRVRRFHRSASERLSTQEKTLRRLAEENPKIAYPRPELLRKVLDEMKSRLGPDEDTWATAS